MKYKVLWIDDDCNTTGQDFIGQAEQDDVDITPFESHEEGMEYLEKHIHDFQAVILDAKVKHKKKLEKSLRNRSTRIFQKHYSSTCRCLPLFYGFFKTKNDGIILITVFLPCIIFLFYYWQP